MLRRDKPASPASPPPHFTASGAQLDFCAPRLPHSKVEIIIFILQVRLNGIIQNKHLRTSHTVTLHKRPRPAGALGIRRTGRSTRRCVHETRSEITRSRWGPWPRRQFLQVTQGVAAVCASQGHRFALLRLLPPTPLAFPLRLQAIDSAGFRREGLRHELQHWAGIGLAASHVRFRSSDFPRFSR